jgi:beta-1,2-mannobiose phosphorylase / 1,2-beta-oligomannan phosphorylase
MSPDGSPHECEGVLNPGAVRDRLGNLLLFPRMVAEGNVSRIGLARVGPSGQIVRLGVVLEPKTAYENRSMIGGNGCEDARVTYVPDIDRYVMAYTAFGPQGARIALAISTDAYAWTRLGLVDFPGNSLNAVDNKDAAFFPEPVLSPAGVLSFAFFHRPMRPETINGQTPIPVILSLPAQEREAACLAFVPVDAVKRDINALCRPAESIRVLEPGPEWGRLKNGAGTPPIRTTLGWLSVFHAVDAVEGPSGPSLLYSAGILINDLRTPHRVTYRSPAPVLVPQTPAERFGTVGNVVFPTGIDEVGPQTIDVYYGAADAKISRVRFSLNTEHE